MSVNRNVMIFLLISSIFIGVFFIGTHLDNQESVEITRGVEYDSLEDFITDAENLFTLGYVKCKTSFSRDYVSKVEMYMDNVMYVYLLKNYDDSVAKFIGDGSFTDDKELMERALSVSVLKNKLHDCLRLSELRFGW